MSLRLRILLLVAVVAVTAVGATAFLGYQQATRQLNAARSADENTRKLIIDELTGYARDHGSWQAVQTLASDLTSRTGQHIELVTLTGDVVVGSGTAEGPAGGPTGTPVLVDPRPTLSLPPSTLIRDDLKPWDATAQTISRYRSGVRLAACLTNHGLTTTATPGENGAPDYTASSDAAATNLDIVNTCKTDTATTSAESAADRNQATTCRATPGPTPTARPRPTSPQTTGPQPDAVQVMLDCLQQVFTDRTSDVTPPPLRLYLGSNDPATTLAAGPVIAAAVLVAMLAIAGTALLSRRLIRPISAVTAASGRLAGGDLTLRVAAQGHDEVAKLAHSFNQMAESLQRAEEQQRRLIADIAHELRTPLANLRGYLEALKDGVFQPSPELLTNLHREAVLQQRIVDDLQDLALAEAGALTYHRAHVDLAELLETCRTAHQAAADAAGIQLQVHILQPAIVHADPDRLRQVISNLLTNALRATSLGGTIVLAAHVADDTATVEVHDTGAGIAAADLPHIFDRLWRADNARQRASGGTGLGLAIARQIISDHNGHIGARSQPGAGTTITLTLPRG